MRLNLNWIFVVISIVLSTQIQAQEDDFYDPNYLRYDNHIYDSKIKTVQLFRKGWNEAFPVIDLNQPGERLHLTFDDLQSDYRNLSYTFIHCTAEWEPSDMMKIEYLDGIEDNLIEQYGFSNTMYQYFVKYDLTFPNQDVSFTKSGNYLVVVYDSDNNDKIVLTRRFFIVEYGATVAPDIKRPTQARYRQNSHEVDFTITQNGIDLIQPFSSLKVVVTQNQNWNDAITDLKPRFINGTTLIYDYEEENIFAAGNEFRVIDIRNINYTSLTTSHISTENDTLNAYIFPDKSRSSKAYLTENDINGHFYLVNDDPRFDSDLEMEYLKVHLGLIYPAKLYQAEIYVYGQLTNWSLSPENRMIWNPKSGAYECTLYLKQGYYNYTYLYKSDNSEKGDIAVIEGSHSAADNEYSFFVYYREPGQIYDRLISYHTEPYPNYN